MDRRAFIGMMAGCLLAAPLAAEAQQAGKVPRIGILTLASSASTPILQAFRVGLRELGYVESQNIALEFRFAHGKPETLASLAAELVRRIWTHRHDGAGAVAKNATQNPHRHGGRRSSQDRAGYKSCPTWHERDRAYLAVSRVEFEAITASS
jgi:hypothetical protein